MGTIRSIVMGASVVLLLACSGCAGVRLPTQSAPSGDPSPSIEATEDSAAALARTHEGEAAFTGTVTGYENPEGRYDGCSDENCVFVDGSPVILSFIETWEVSCLDRSGLDRDRAIQAKKDILAIGTKVEVIRDREPSETAYNHYGFIHRLDDDGDPLDASANEELVRTGYWVPDYLESNSFDVGHYMLSKNLVTGEVTESGAPAYALKPRPRTAVQEEYAQRLIDAANGARVTRTGGQDVCIQQIEDRIASDDDLYVSYQESSRRLEADYERWKRENPGWNQCIDGDGDGICHEG